MNVVSNSTQCEANCRLVCSYREPNEYWRLEQLSLKFHVTLDNGNDAKAHSHTYLLVTRKSKIDMIGWLFRLTTDSNMSFLNNKIRS